MQQDNLEYDLKSIRGYDDWAKIEPIHKGWSKDVKYQIITKEGTKLLLRISDAERFEAKKKEYEIIQKYATLGIQMSMPLDFGLFNHSKNVYMLLTWVEGRDLRDILPEISEKEQYDLGIAAGQMLRKIHSIPIADADLPKQTNREKKLMKLQQYIDSDVRILGDEVAIQYVKDNINLLWTEPPVYQHGDFHPGNLIYTPEHEIGVIDFNRWDIGDPYEEFYKIESFGTEVSIPYSCGEIDGYFGKSQIPENFWRVLAVYVAHASLFSIKWAVPFGQKDVDGMVERCKIAFEHYDEFRKIIPTWYEKYES